MVIFLIIKKVEGKTFQHLLQNLFTNFLNRGIKTKSKEKYIGIPLLEMQAKFLSFEKDVFSHLLIFILLF